MLPLALETKYTCLDHPKHIRKAQSIYRCAAFPFHGPRASAATNLGGALWVFAPWLHGLKSLVQVQESCPHT